jgi:hypothetical protein
MKFSVVTTFNSTGYQSYGKRMIETFAQNWPGNVDLLVYTEGCNIESTTPNVKVFDLEQASPALVTFKNTWRGIPKANGDVSLDSHIKYMLYLPRPLNQKQIGCFGWTLIWYATVLLLFQISKDCVHLIRTFVF